MIFKAAGNLKDFIKIISEPVLLEWATSQISKDTENEAEDFLAKFELAKPWLDLHLWNYLKKQEDIHENKKSMVAKALGTLPEKINVVNIFDEKVKEMGLPKEALDKLLGKVKDA